MINTCTINKTRWPVRILTGALLAVLVTVICSLTIISTVSLGGMVSEKMLGSNGVAGSSLLLGSAANATLSVLGFAPVVVTQTVTDTNMSGGVTTATLHGTVTGMNGLPTATGYFQWGYAAGALTNTTSTFAVNAAGNYSLAITGFNANNKVYYRFVTDADGTAYGTVVGFVAAPGTGGFLIKTLLRVLLALSICAGVFLAGMKGTGKAFLIYALIGVIAFIVIDGMITALF